MSQVKSKERVANHGEVFTNEREVNAMLDMVKQETERIDSRFLEPACGDGNFLAEILRRKLVVVKQRYGKSVSEYEKYCFVAVGSIYGVELLQDNAEDCRNRLFGIVENEYMRVCKKKPNPRFLPVIRYVIDCNILCGDALTLLQDDGEPIIFSEWSMAMGVKVKRRDFRLDEMLQGNVSYGETMSLFGSSGAATIEWEYDEETQAFIPLPIREYPLISFYEVIDCG
jgi:type III restriction system methylase